MIEAQENTAFIERLKSKIRSNVAAIRELERFEKIAYAVPIIVAITILTIYFFQFNNKISSDPSTFGTFGDYFGGILNPVISFMTLYGVVHTLKQNKEAIKHSAQATEAATNQAMLADKEFKAFETRQKVEEESRKQEALLARTMDLYKIWISPDMQRIRTEVLAWLSSSKITEETISNNGVGQCIPDVWSNEGQTYYLGKHRKSTKPETVKNYISIGTISLFFKDLATLLSIQKLDEEFLLDIMGFSLTLWIETYKNIDFKSDASDNSEESKKLNSIHKEGIIALEDLMKRRHEKRDHST